jgi:hypothetical protein
MKNLRQLVLLMIPLFLNGCLSLPTLQTGKTIGKNNFEYAINGSYGKYSQNSILDFEGDFDYKPVVGLRVKYGWSDKFDLGINLDQSTFIGPCFKYQFLGDQNSKSAASIGLEGSFLLGAFVFGNFTNYLTTPLFLSAHPSDYVAIYFTPRFIHTSVYVFASETTDDLLGPGPKLNVYGHSYGIVLGRKYKFALELSNFSRRFFKPTQISLGYIYSFRD